jgi:hypothetical protein
MISYSPSSETTLNFAQTHFIHAILFVVPVTEYINNNNDNIVKLRITNLRHIV